MNKQTATRNLDEIITKVEGARLRISEHHIVKIIGISKYSNKRSKKKCKNNFIKTKFIPINEINL